MSNPFPGDYNQGHLKGEEPSSKKEKKGRMSKEEPSSAKALRSKMCKCKGRGCSKCK